MRNIKFPKLDEELAEFIGILLGDGHIAPHNHEISVIGSNISDKDYIRKFVKNKMISLFNINPSIYKQPGVESLRCMFYSKDVANYLTENFILWKGNKLKCKLFIPKQIKDNHNFIKACIRGLVDTDGGVYRHHEKSAQLMFFSKSETLISDVKSSLESLGYKPKITKRKSGYVIYLFDKDTDKYFNEIGTNNPKNQIKYDNWKKNGIMPNTAEIINMLNAPIV